MKLKKLTLLLATAILGLSCVACRTVPVKPDDTAVPPVTSPGTNNDKTPGTDRVPDVVPDTDRVPGTNDTTPGTDRVPGTGDTTPGTDSGLDTNGSPGTGNTPGM